MAKEMIDIKTGWVNWRLKILERAKQRLHRANLQAVADPDSVAEANMTNNFPSFLDTSPSTGSSSSVPRLAPSPIAQQQQQVNNNGNGGGMNGIPMAAGQQADVNFLYQKLCELSEVLRENREKTAGIIASAEELAVSIPTRALDALYNLLLDFVSSALIIANNLHRT